MTHIPAFDFWIFFTMFKDYLSKHKKLLLIKPLHQVS